MSNLELNSTVKYVEDHFKNNIILRIDQADQKFKENISSIAFWENLSRDNYQEPEARQCSFEVEFDTRMTSQRCVLGRD